MTRQKPDPPWKWIDDLCVKAEQALAVAGIHRDTRCDYRSVMLDCPLCYQVGTLRACYAGRNRRLRLICSHASCINYVKEDGR